MALIFTLCTIKIINNNKLQYLQYKMLLLKLLMITNYNIYIALCTIKLIYYTPFPKKVKFFYISSPTLILLNFDMKFLIFSNFGFSFVNIE